MLESLWNNLKDIVKVEENNPISQAFQPHIPCLAYNPPQIPPAISNHPRPMEVRFDPLAFPIVLHDLPQNYPQRISFFDGEGNFTARHRMDTFEYFIDLEEVDYDDAKMRLFAQSLFGEEKIWFKYLPARPILTFEVFKTLFLDSWEDKKSPLQVLSQYNNPKKGSLSIFMSFPENL